MAESGSPCDSSSDSCSTCKSSCPSVDSDGSDWEKAVDKKGNLFYVEPYPETSIPNDSPQVPSEPKGKFSKLIPKRQKKKQEGHEAQVKPESTLWFKEYQVQIRVCPVGVDATSRLSESLFGIVPARWDDLVVVQAVLPHCHLARHQVIRIGDALVKVAGSDVNMNNLNELLVQVLHLNKVQLVFRRYNIKVEAETQDEEESSNLRAALYIALEDDDILYKYGTTSLSQLRGIFITLANEVQDITGTQPINTVLQFGDITLNVCYAKEGKDTLVLILPDYVLSKEALETLTRHTSDLLCWEFGSLRSSFSDSSNKAYLDGFFQSVMDSSENTRAAPCPVPLPSDIQIRVDMLLDEYESCYAENFMEQDYLKYQRPFTVVGSCLFHKGLLITSHLPPSALRLVHFYLHYHRLLDSKPVSQLVVWRSVCPILPSEDCYQQPEDIRWFLMIIGQDHEILAVILESGGCAVRWEGAVPPDPVYVNRAESLLTLLEDEGLINILRHWMEKSQNPPLVDPSAFLKGKDIPIAPSADTSGNQTGSTRTLSDPGDTILRQAGGSCTSSSPSEDSQYHVVGRREANRLAHLSGSNQTLPPINHLIETSTLCSATTPLFQLTVGAWNTLFYMMTFLDSEGVILCPQGGNVNYGTSVWDAILKNFFGAYHVMHHQLNSSQDDCLKEQGMMFHFESEDRVLHYWVTGRKFIQPYRKTVFLCYQDATPQNLVEIGFKFGLGLCV